MGRFLVFVGVALLFMLAGLAVYGIGSLIMLSIRRREKRLEVEEEACEKAKEKIKKYPVEEIGKDKEE